MNLLPVHAKMIHQKGKRIFSLQSVLDQRAT